jgi:hypothetical protein
MRNYFHHLDLMPSTSYYNYLSCCYHYCPMTIYQQKSLLKNNVKDSIFYIKNINYIYLQVRKKRKTSKKIHRVPFILGISFFRIPITKKYHFSHNTFYNSNRTTRDNEKPTKFFTARALHHFFTK